MNSNFDQLSALAAEAVERNRCYANEQLGFSLPEDFIHGLFVEGFLGEFYSLRDAVTLLMNGESFPRLVDLAVRGIYGEKTFVLWIPSGHRASSYINVSWNNGLGPFKPVGVMSPKSHFRLSKIELEGLALEWLENVRPS